MSNTAPLNARAKILAKIKNALITPTSMPFTDLDYSTEPFETSTDSLEIQFAKAFTTVQGSFMYCETWAEMCTFLKQLLQDKKLRRVHCLDIALHKNLTDSGVEHISNDKYIHNAEAAITSVDALCARTGSVVYTSAGNQGRTVQVFPPIQIIVAYSYQIVPDIKEALIQVTEQYANNLPSMISFATGPSRTADIEKTLVLGAHGPREVYLFLIDEA